MGVQSPPIGQILIQMRNKERSGVSTEWKSRQSLEKYFWSETPERHHVTLGKSRGVICREIGLKGLIITLILSPLSQYIAYFPPFSFVPAIFEQRHLTTCNVVCYVSGSIETSNLCFKTFVGQLTKWSCTLTNKSSETKITSNDDYNKGVETVVIMLSLMRSRFQFEEPVKPFNWRVTSCKQFL